MLFVRFVLGLFVLTDTRSLFMKLLPIILLLTFSLLSHASLGHFKKVVWVVFENTNYSKAINQPDFKNYANKGVLFTNMLAATHPSQGNYIEMIAGSTLGVKNDNNINLTGAHLGDLLENAGLTWKVYAENYPGNCFMGSSSGEYARKHVPFMSFTNVNTNSARCLNIEDETHFLNDYKNGSLPDYSMYIPNLQNDGHNTGVDYAGKFLTTKFGAILNNPSAMGDVIFIITFDESGVSLSNQIYTAIIGANITPGNQNSQSVNHASFLRLIEDEFQIGNLGRDDSKAAAINGIWK